MAENLVLQQHRQPEGVVSNVVMARCGSNTCDHTWIVAYLPMPLEKAAFLMKRAACPKCAHERPEVAHD